MTTLKELAKLLNISVSTVSKALNDSHEISENTKRRVNELAEKLNYKYTTEYMKNSFKIMKTSVMLYIFKM